MLEPSYVPLQPLPGWEGPGNSILAAHCGTVGYLLPAPVSGAPQPGPAGYLKNEEVWRDLIHVRVGGGQRIALNGFHVMNWFPRAPGLYHTPSAEFARQEALQFLHPGLMQSPIRDHAAQAGLTPTKKHHTVVFTPAGKMSMLEGGIGCVRLKPIRISGVPHWLMSATSDGIAHTGVPIAVPQDIYTEIWAPLLKHGLVCANLEGELDFLEDPFSRVFDASAMIPRLYLRVTRLQPREPSAVRPEVSVAVSFVSEYQGPPSVYATYVTFEPDLEGSFEDAASWMKKVYVEGEYRGQIITDFDQTRTTFPEAWLTLARVMDRAVPQDTLRKTMELMHARASVDAYFTELDRREALFSRKGAQRNKIFISYAHAAEKETGWVQRMRTHLAGVVHGAGVEVWDDTRIEPGERWKEQIRKAIDSTRVAVLVLTADFLASDFVRNSELPPLLEAAEADGARILCVSGSQVHLSGPAKFLLQYQFVNAIDEPLQALTPDARESVYTKLASTVEKTLGRN